MVHLQLWDPEQHCGDRGSSSSASLPALGQSWCSASTTAPFPFQFAVNQNHLLADPAKPRPEQRYPCCCKGIYQKCTVESRSLEGMASGRKTVALRNIPPLHMAVFGYTEEACNSALLGKPAFPQPPLPRAQMLLPQECWDTVGSM